MWNPEKLGRKEEPSRASSGALPPPPSCAGPPPPLPPPSSPEYAHWHTYCHSFQLPLKVPLSSPTALFWLLILQGNHPPHFPSSYPPLELLPFVIIQPGTNGHAPRPAHSPPLPPLATERDNHRPQEAELCALMRQPRQSVSRLAGLGRIDSQAVNLVVSNSSGILPHGGLRWAGGTSISAVVGPFNEVTQCPYGASRNLVLGPPSLSIHFASTEFFPCYPLLPVLFASTKLIQSGEAP